MNKLITAIAIILFFTPVSLATGVSDDFGKLTEPTLDTLKGKPIPGTSPVEYYPESGYKLKETGSSDQNAITKYLKNEDGTLSEKYYQITLKKTEYGDKTNYTPADNKYLKWTTNSEGRTELSTGTNTDHDITYYVNNTRSTADSRITTGTSGANVGKNFIGLNYTNASASIYGGAIASDNSSIGNINGDFIGNVVSSYNKEAYNSASGGAISNYRNSTIGNITGDFIGNNATSHYSAKALGGAIYNAGSSIIGSIKGDFIGNNASAANFSEASGGAIYNDNDGKIGSIKGNFIGNYAFSSASSGAIGGAIYIYNGEIGDITGNFIGNHASADTGGTYGGAIYNNNGTTGNITGDFIGNYTNTSSLGASYGGAIQNYNNGKIGNITGDFISNYASSSPNTYGGAISNDNSSIGNITGDFIGNYVSSDKANATGGAISNINGASIGNISGDFINNYAYSSSKGANG